ncbi:hypothetical protein ACHAPO_007269 [Fusarium lateritium]
MPQSKASGNKHQQFLERKLRRISLRVQELDQRNKDLSKIIRTSAETTNELVNASKKLLRDYRKQIDENKQLKEENKKLAQMIEKLAKDDETLVKEDQTLVKVKKEPVG